MAVHASSRRGGVQHLPLSVVRRRMRGRRGHQLLTGMREHMMADWLVLLIIILTSFLD